MSHDDLGAALRELTGGARFESVPTRDNAAAAMLRLGRRLLVGKGLAAEPEEGVALIARAAERGEAEALNLLATLTAAGAWTRQSWPRALDLLAEAAGRGSQDAREQLMLIAGERGSDWHALRDGIDLERHVAPPRPEQICDSPRIWRAPGFAREGECARLIAKARGKLKPAKMYNRVRRTTGFDAMRTNSEFLFDITQSGVTLVLLRIRIGLLVSLPAPHMEPPQILHYAPGQELRAHFDFLQAEGGRDGTREGDRVVTFLLYLNDDYAGGETEFLKADLRTKGSRGDALFFANLKDGKPDPASLHRGAPVTRGEKWLLSQWIHNRPFAG